MSIAIGCVIGAWIGTALGYAFDLDSDPGYAIGSTFTVIVIWLLGGLT